MTQNVYSRWGFTVALIFICSLSTVVCMRHGNFSLKCGETFFDVLVSPAVRVSRVFSNERGVLSISTWLICNGQYLLRQVKPFNTEFGETAKVSIISSYFVTKSECAVGVDSHDISINTSFCHDKKSNYKLINSNHRVTR